MVEVRDVGFLPPKQAANGVILDGLAAKVAIFDFPPGFMQCQSHF